MQQDERRRILDEVQSLAGQILGMDDLYLTEESSARDVPGWDSLTHVQIIIAAERAFGIRMTSTEVSQLENAGSLVTLIQQHQSRQ